MLQSIVSVHFPKAGGSSLRTQLQSAFGAALLLDYSHDPLGQAGNYVADSLPPSVQMVHGHFRATRYAGVRDAAMITFLRNPIDCLLSVYYFWLDYPRNENSVHGRFLDERPTIIEFARWSLLQRLMSATYFGGFDMNRFSFVGFHEFAQLRSRRIEQADRRTARSSAARQSYGVRLRRAQKPQK